MWSGTCSSRFRDPADPVLLPVVVVLVVVLVVVVVVVVIPDFNFIGEYKPTSTISII